MRPYIAMFRDEELRVEASDPESARNAACAELRKLHPEDRKVQPHLIAITPASDDISVGEGD